LLTAEREGGQHALRHCWYVNHPGADAVRDALIAGATAGLGTASFAKTTQDDTVAIPMQMPEGTISPSSQPAK